MTPFPDMTQSPARVLPAKKKTPVDVAVPQKMPDEAALAFSGGQHRKLDLLRADALKRLAMLLYPAAIPVAWSRGTMVHDLVDMGQGRPIALGERGLIARSQDDGKTWDVAHHMMLAKTNRLFRLSSDALIAQGESNDVVWSGDGGKTWKTVLLGGVTFDTIRSLREGSFLSITSDGKLLRSDDWGERWYYPQIPPAPEGSGGGAVLRFLTVGIRLVVIGGAGFIARSLDKGKTWKTNTLDEDKMPLQMYSAGLRQLVSLTTNAIMRSTDDGETWHKKCDYPDVFEPFCHKLKDGSFVVINIDGNVQRSDARGMHWQEIETGAHNRINGSMLLGNGSIIAFGNFDAIMRSDDGGLTWTDRPIVADCEFLWGVSGARDVLLQAEGPHSRLYSPDFGKRWKPVVFDDELAGGAIFDTHGSSFFTTTAEGRLCRIGRDYVDRLKALPLATGTPEESMEGDEMLIEFINKLPDHLKDHNSIRNIRAEVSDIQEQRDALMDNQLTL